MNRPVNPQGPYELLKKTLLYRVLEKRRPKYAALLLDLAREIDTVLGKIHVYFASFTDHTLTHSIHVVKNIELLLRRGGSTRRKRSGQETGEEGEENALETFSDMELLALGFAALLHDIGMLPQSREEAAEAHPASPKPQRIKVLERIRRDHHIRSAKAILGLSEVCYHARASSESEAEIECRSESLVSWLARKGFSRDTAQEIAATVAFLAAKHREKGAVLLSSLASNQVSTGDQETDQTIRRHIGFIGEGFVIINGSERVYHWLLALLLMLADELDIRRGRSILAIDSMDIDIPSFLGEAYVSYIAAEGPGDSLRHHILNMMATNGPERNSDIIALTGKVNAGGYRYQDVKEALHLLSKVSEKIDETLRRIPYSVNEYGDPKISEVLKRLPTVFIVDVKIGESRVWSDLRTRADPRLFSKLLADSLYGGKVKYVLRELVSNAIDSCKRKIQLYKQRGRRYRDAYRDYEPIVELKLYNDNSGFVLEVADNGYGMSMYEVEHYLLRAGSSVYSEDRWRDIRPISMHGIGFLSVWMVADRVEVETVSEDRPGDTVKLLLWSPSAPAAIAPLGFGGIPPFPGNSRSGTRIRIYLKDGEVYEELRGVLSQLTREGLTVIGLGTGLLYLYPRIVAVHDRGVDIKYVKVRVVLDEEEWWVRGVIPERIIVAEDGMPLRLELEGGGTVEYYLAVGLGLWGRVLFRGLITRYGLSLAKHCSLPFGVDIVSIPPSWGLDLRKEELVVEKGRVEEFLRLLEAHAICSFLASDSRARIYLPQKLKTPLRGDSEEGMVLDEVEKLCGELLEERSVWL